MDVAVESVNPYVARAGSRVAGLGVRRDATVRADVRAVRESTAGREPLSADSTVGHGETVRFGLVD